MHPTNHQKKKESNNAPWGYLGQSNVLKDRSSGTNRSRKKLKQKSTRPTDIEHLPRSQSVSILESDESTEKDGSRLEDEISLKLKCMEKNREMFGEQKHMQYRDFVGKGLVCCQCVKQYQNTLPEWLTCGCPVNKKVQPPAYNHQKYPLKTQSHPFTTNDYLNYQPINITHNLTR
eukprot:TRINITY_DN9105_c0_g1_i8.p3 TRINITY_DN9105_c0_g1~~TRINITY_DN9105_c0_g1_i8.p3  ORF type:complete len:175 (+),score=7.45 TRINITY_DN9105_c0_g1_i8:76-600(+)